MKALVLDGRPRVVEDHPEPERTPGEAIIAMRKAGVCDTDLALMRGYMQFRGVLGHEFVGQVVSASDASWLGRRVVADINASCGQCEECRLRNGHHCVHRTVLGIAGRDGAFAERLRIPERCLVAVPDSVSDDAAVFAEPLAAALHVLDEVVVSEQKDAVVVGDGKLGQLIARALSSAGIAVTVIGHHADKLRLAAAAGASTRLEHDVDDRVRSSVVVEATGSAGGLARAISLTLPRGTLVLKTTVAEPVTMDLSRVVIDEIRIIGSRCGDLRTAVSALAQRRIDPTPLIAARYPLAEADRALFHASQRGVLKVLIESR